MDPETAKPYGPEYAEGYEARWHETAWGSEAEHIAGWVRARIDEDTRWLDVGCGTGYYLRRFAGVDRAGIDLSPDMLAVATATSPDAAFHLGDIREPVEEWRGRWDLVTCFGYPWSYFEGMADFSSFVTNLAAWTAPEGACALQVGDITDLTGLRIPLDFDGGAPAVDMQVVTGTIWNYFEDGRFLHENMIWPSIDVWVRLFAKRFRRVEIRYLPFGPGVFIAPRLLVATGHRSEADAPAEIVEHPEPAPPPAPAARLYDLPLSYLVRRMQPWRREFWTSVRRRVRRR